MTVVELSIVGEPAPQGSKKVIPHRATGRMILIDTNPPKLKRWRKAIQTAAEQWRADHDDLTIDEPVTVHMSFQFARPASDKYRTRHAVKPDKDKLLRAVLDALVDARLIRDDSRVWRYHVTATYSHSPGVDIRIECDGEREAESRELLKRLRRGGNPMQQPMSEKPVSVFEASGAEGVGDGE